jgi:hypothetical protein
VVLTSALGTKVMKGEALAGITLFIGEGEREEAVPVLHVGDGRLTACQSTGDTACRVPLPRVTDRWLLVGFFNLA